MTQRAEFCNFRLTSTLSQRNSTHVVSHRNLSIWEVPKAQCTDAVKYRMPSRAIDRSLHLRKHSPTREVGIDLASFGRPRNARAPWTSMDHGNMAGLHLVKSGTWNTGINLVSSFLAQKISDARGIDSAQRRLLIDVLQTQSTFWSRKRFAMLHACGLTPLGSLRLCLPKPSARNWHLLRNIYDRGQIADLALDVRFDRRP